MNIADRADAYNAAFPNRPGLFADAGMVVGCWMIGACYKNPNPLYGAYPRGYLERIHAMFPDARLILHAFSGGLTREAATEPWKQELTGGDGRNFLVPHVELVDMHGPEQGRFPTWQGDLFDYIEQPENLNKFDLILADPPYSADDAEKYDCPPPNRRAIMQALRKVCKRGGNLVWLDQVWPQHRKDQWRTWGTVGLIRSTNHRVRAVSFFEAV